MIKERYCTEIADLKRDKPNHNQIYNFSEPSGEVTTTSVVSKTTTTKSEIESTTVGKKHFCISIKL